jgi:hypothetical protein
MKPRRTHESTSVYRLPGGTEDNDLWVTADVDDGGHPVVCSTWVPTDEERALLAAGENVELVIWGTAVPPLAMRTTAVSLGRRPEDAQ